MEGTKSVTHIQREDEISDNATDTVKVYDIQDIVNHNDQ